MAEPILLEAFFEALEARWRELPPDVRPQLGVRERLRAEYYLRTPGDWSGARLRDGLRACVVWHEDQVPGFEAAFNAVVGEVEDRVFRGDGAAVRQLPSEAAPEVTVGEGKRPVAPAWRLYLGVVCVLGVGLGYAAWVNRPVPPTPEKIDDVAPPPAPPPGPDPIPSDPLTDWRGTPPPEAPRISVETSPWTVPWDRIAAGALALAGLGLAGWGVRRVESERLPEVPAIVHDPQASQRPFRLPGGVPADTLDPRGLDLVADAVGTVLGDERPFALDVPRSVQATVERAGYPTPLAPRERQLQRVIVLGEQGGTGERLSDGLVARGVPAEAWTWSGTADVLTSSTGARTRLDRLSEGDRAAVVLIVGEARGERRDALARSFGAFPRVAWIETSDRAVWNEAVAVVARAMPVFGLDAEGLAALAEWIRASRPTPAVVRRRARSVEERLGDALPWAAALTTWPGDVTREHAEWLRAELHELLPTLPGTAWDRLVVVAGDPFRPDEPTREVLEQALSTRPELRRRAIEAQLAAIEATTVDPGTAAEGERETARAVLLFEQAQLVPEDRAARLDEAADALRRAATYRSGARLRRVAPLGAELRRVVRLELPEGSELTRRKLRAAFTGEAPEPWTARRWATLAGAVVVAGLGTTVAAWPREHAADSVRLVGEGWEAAWVGSGTETTTKMNLLAIPEEVDVTRPVPAHLRLRRGNRVWDTTITEADVVGKGAVTISVGADGAEVAGAKDGCVDEDSVPGWAILMCAKGEEWGGVAGGDALVVRATREEMGEPRIARMMHLLLESGTAFVGVVADSAKDEDLLSVPVLLDGVPGAGKGGSFPVTRRTPTGDSKTIVEVRHAHDMTADAVAALLTGVAGEVGGIQVRPLPAREVTLRCVDGAGAALPCVWTGRFAGGADDDVRLSSAPVTVALADGHDWAFRVSAAGWPDVSTTLAPGATEAMVTFGGPVARIRWKPVAGVAATLDGKPWKGDAVDLSDGQSRRFELQKGCARTSELVTAGAAGTKAAGELAVVGGGETWLGMGAPSPVDTTVRLHLPTTLQVQSMTVRVGTTTWAPRPVRGDGVWSATIPPLPCGSVEVSVDASVGWLGGSDAAIPQLKKTVQVVPNAPTVVDFDGIMVIGDAPPPKEAVVATEEPKNPPETPVATSPSFPADLVAGEGKPYQMRFKPVRGGTYAIGSPTDEPDREDDETRHSVTLSPYWIGETEVTQRQYRELVGSNPSSAEYKGVSLRGDTLPVQNISWYDAVKLANALSEKEGLRPIYVIAGTNVSWSDQGDGYRLPTEAEWEVAARAGSKEARPGLAGASQGSPAEPLAGMCKLGNVADLAAGAKVGFKNLFPCDDGYPGLAPVRSFSGNDWGLYDTVGNVWEWTWDWYGTYGSDPRGASGGDWRVVRGGSWANVPAFVRVAFRGSWSPDYAFNVLGVRLARSAPVSPPAGP